MTISDNNVISKARSGQTKRNFPLFPLHLGVVYPPPITLSQSCRHHIKLPVHSLRPTDKHLGNPLTLLPPLTL